MRNPLAAIKLRLDLTAAGDGLPEPAQQALEATSQEISRLDRLVGDLLLVAGKKMGPRQAVELGALVRRRAEALGAWAETQRVAVRAAGEGVADADPRVAGPGPSTTCCATRSRRRRPTPPSRRV